MLVWTALNSTVINAHAGEFQFTSSVSLAETYNDNIDLEPERNEEDDFITYLTPSFSLSYLTQKTDLRATYSPSFLFYAENSGENEVNHNADLDFNARLTRRLSVSATDSLAFIPAEDITGREAGDRSYPSDQINNTFNNTWIKSTNNRTFIRFI